MSLRLENFQPLARKFSSQPETQRMFWFLSFFCLILAVQSANQIWSPDFARNFVQWQQVLPNVRVSVDHEHAHHSVVWFRGHDVYAVVWLDFGGNMSTLSSTSFEVPTVSARLRATCVTNATQRAADSITTVPHVNISDYDRRFAITGAPPFGVAHACPMSLNCDTIVVFWATSSSTGSSIHVAKLTLVQSNGSSNCVRTSYWNHTKNADLLMSPLAFGAPQSSFAWLELVQPEGADKASVVLGGLVLRCVIFHDRSIKQCVNESAMWYALNFTATDISIIRSAFSLLPVGPLAESQPALLVVERGIVDNLRYDVAYEVRLFQPKHRYNESGIAVFLRDYPYDCNDLIATEKHSLCMSTINSIDTPIPLVQQRNRTNVIPSFENLGVLTNPSLISIAAFETEIPNALVLLLGDGDGYVVSGLLSSVKLERSGNASRCAVAGVKGQTYVPSLRFRALDGDSQLPQVDMWTNVSCTDEYTAALVSGPRGMATVSVLLSSGLHVAVFNPFVEVLSSDAPLRRRSLLEEFPSCVLVRSRFSIEAGVFSSRPTCSLLNRATNVAVRASDWDYSASDDSKYVAIVSIFTPGKFEFELNCSQASLVRIVSGSVRVMSCNSIERCGSTDCVCDDSRPGISKSGSSCQMSNTDTDDRVCTPPDAPRRFKLIVPSESSGDTVKGCRALVNGTESADVHHDGDDATDHAVTLYVPLQKVESSILVIEGSCMFQQGSHNAYRIVTKQRICVDARAATRVCELKLDSTIQCTCPDGQFEVGDTCHTTHAFWVGIAIIVAVVVVEVLVLCGGGKIHDMSYRTKSCFTGGFFLVFVAHIIVVSVAAPDDDLVLAIIDAILAIGFFPSFAVVSWVVKSLEKRCMKALVAATHTADQNNNPYLPPTVNGNVEKHPWDAGDRHLFVNIGTSAVASKDADVTFCRDCCLDLCDGGWGNLKETIKRMFK